MTRFLNSMFSMFSGVNMIDGDDGLFIELEVWAKRGQAYRNLVKFTKSQI
jgi:hypothetical protein